MQTVENNSMLKAALYYCEKLNFSVIPIKTNKTPFVKWEKYQTIRPTRDQIKDWWGKWPNANIGICTGGISGVDVLDCDSEAGEAALNEYLPDDFITPISKSPRGKHYYFRHTPGLSNGVRVITDCDIRTTGGYIIAPPSKNSNGLDYAWMDDLKITSIKISAIPGMLFEILLQGNANSSEHINTIYNAKGGVIGGGAQGGGNLDVTTTQQNVTKRNISFEEPGRDDTLFHLANYLVKGSMDVTSIEKYLEFFGAHCTPPYPEKELKIKILSALDRAKKRKKGVMDEIRDLINVTSGNINVTYCYNAQQSVTKNEKTAVRMALGRLVEEGLLEKSGRKAGEYRIIDGICESEDWQKAEINNINLWLPFELNEMINIPSGSIILIAGSQDAGKTALLMNIVKENMDKWPVNYFSSEINAAGFKNRINLFDAPFYDDWKVKFYTRMHGFADVIKPGELNIIDYLEMHDNFFEVAKYLAAMFEKLKGKGVAVVAIQKDPRKEFARGGSFAEEKPVLSLALDYGICRINKFKGEFRGENPRGKEYHYKLLHGSNFIMVKHWHKPHKLGD